MEPIFLPKPPSSEALIIATSYLVYHFGVRERQIILRNYSRDKVEQLYPIVFCLRANDGRKNGNSKNINVTAFKNIIKMREFQKARREVTFAGKFYKNLVSNQISHKLTPILISARK